MSGHVHPVPPQAALIHVRSARVDLRWWALLLIGLVFAYAGWTIDPRSNCSADGECAPWLVPVAFVIGVAATMMAAMQLIINPGHGSCIDTATGELVWWRGRLSDGRTSDEGSIALRDIARCVVVSGSDDDDLYLYDHQGALLPFPGIDVVSWPYQNWARSLARHVPDLTIEEKAR